MSDGGATAADSPHLERRLGLLQATATNLIGMIGVGPFLTIPAMLAATGGPHILYAWIAGAVLALTSLGINRHHARAKDQSAGAARRRVVMAVMVAEIEPQGRNG